MRTPLSVIVSQLERVLRSRPCEVESYLPFCEKSLKAALQLRNITNQLFLLSEVERLGEQDLKREIRLEDIIETALTHVQESHPQIKKNILWKKNLRNSVISGNGALFLSIVTNLLENALKFSKGQVQLGWISKGREVVLIVEDDGPGIRPESRAQVFHPFFKEKNKEVNTGHGLGLAIVEGCVQALKGRITLGESGLGGLLVEVTLPVEA